MGIRERARVNRDADIWVRVKYTAALQERIISSHYNETMASIQHSAGWLANIFLVGCRHDINIKRRSR